MCGISGLFGRNVKALDAMLAIQHHRGPDAHGKFVDASGRAALGHNRLSIIDLSDAGRQPMTSCDGRWTIVFNGEIYNYLELRRELASYPFQSRSDTEVILAAYQRWGLGCLDRMLGMFAFLIWDQQEQSLFAARDRFGVKPLYYHLDSSGGLALASEIKGLRAGGVACEPDPVAWSRYLGRGLYESKNQTFWKDVYTLAPGHWLRWRDDRFSTGCWYDLPERIGDTLDDREESVVIEELLALMVDSLRLRFRSDVPIGINISGGLDSSLLLGLVHQIQGGDSDVQAYTFTTGDEHYDELPWVEQMLSKTSHPLTISQLRVEDVPELAHSVTYYQDEPFGGLPTLAYAQLMATARKQGTIVLLDGQGVDEAWAGYDYYQSALSGHANVATVQGTSGPIQRTDCLTPEFQELGRDPSDDDSKLPFPDRLRQIQYRDTRHTKLPRALRFNDRISMRVSTELREPFLDHRLFELAFRQPASRKRDGNVGKVLPRRLAERLLPEGLRLAPKRPLQTPQREWLRGPLSQWADDLIETALSLDAGRWLDPHQVRKQWKRYRNGEGDNSFFVWQWVSLALCLGQPYTSPATDPVPA
jgi:asparagine synthase (glutamine-hydrolysing)